MRGDWEYIEGTESATAPALPGVVILMTWGEVQRVDNIVEVDSNSEAPVPGSSPHNRPPQLRKFLHMIRLHAGL